MRRKLNGFTLSETLIVVVVLGIIATLTIPALVNKNKESVAKTKVRKAMAAYESALNKMIIENDLKSDDTLTAWAGDAENNCANSTNYFKKVQGDGCIFKTSDGIWWNISDIERPVISFKETNADNAATITANANNANDKTAFVLVGRFGNDGSLRVDDLAYETGNGHANQNSDKQVTKLYTLLGMKKASSSGSGSVSCDESSPFCQCQKAGEDTCTVNGVKYTKLTLTAESYEECGYEAPPDGSDAIYVCSGVLTSNAGDYYVAIEGVSRTWYNSTNARSEDNCSTSSQSYGYCTGAGDYYNLAKTYCESSGGGLATVPELKSLANQGKLTPGSWVWTSKSEKGRQAYDVDSGDYFAATYETDYAHVICVGK